MSSAVSRLLTRVIKDSGLTKQAYGQKVGLSSSRISHLLTGDPHYTLGTSACLRVAQVSKLSPALVLRTAGKRDLADVVDALLAAHGQPLTKSLGIPLSLIEEQWLEARRRMSPRERRAIEVLFAVVEANHRHRPAPAAARRGLPRAG